MKDQRHDYGLNTLQWWLDECQVCHIDEVDDNNWWPESMPYAVVHPHKGFIGMFPDAVAALRYRLSVINDEINSGREGGA